jgi:ribose/xylose/arabinose/galactoside ABC-type transport system permease subunit
MLSLARGLAILLADRRQFPIPGEHPGWVRALAQKDNPFLYFDPGVWSLFVLAALAFVVLRFTVYGRHVYAIGSNESTARLCGVAVGRTKVWTYTLAGLLSGWAGVVMFAQSNGCNPSGSTGRELEVIAAVVIGGASLAGGQGTVGGALLGVLIWGVMTNGLGYINVHPEVKYLLMGAIVIINTALSRWRRA